MASSQEQVPRQEAPHTTVGGNEQIPTDQGVVDISSEGGKEVEGNLDDAIREGAAELEDSVEKLYTAIDALQEQGEIPVNEEDPIARKIKDKIKAISDKYHDVAILLGAGGISIGGVGGAAGMLLMMAGGGDVGFLAAAGGTAAGATGLALAALVELGRYFKVRGLHNFLKDQPKNVSSHS